jgi:hypothetical protein
VLFSNARAVGKIEKTRPLHKLKGLSPAFTTIEVIVEKNTFFKRFYLENEGCDIFSV